MPQHVRIHHPATEEILSALAVANIHVAEADDRTLTVRVEHDDAQVAIGAVDEALSPLGHADAELIPTAK